MNPGTNEALAFLSTRYNLKKSFYKYVDYMTSANLNKCNLQFLKTCKEDKIIPKSFVPHHLKMNHKTPFPPLYEEIINYHIQNCKQQVNRSFSTTKRKFSIFQQEFYKNSDNLNLLGNLIDIAHETMNNKVNLRKTHHSEKLESLFQNSEWTKNSNPNIIINVSTYSLNQTEKVLLGYGLSFSLKNLDPWINLHINYKNWRSQQKSEDTNLDILYGVLLQSTAINQSKLTYPRRFYSTLYKLLHNEDIVISRSDKGNNIVIMNSVDYINKSLTLLNDQNTYSICQNNPLKTSQSNYNKELNSILTQQKPLINTFKSYLPSLSQFYAIPKTHKPNLPLRPIISNTNCTTYKLSKWLANNLKFLVGNISTSHIKNSVSFIQSIKNINFSQYNPVSFDVVSLFTNVPVLFTLELLETYLVENNINLILPFQTFKKLILLTLDHAYFKFHNSYYKQISGLSMGSPLSPILSNIFMELIEFYHIFPQFKNNNIKWFRYVDDIFALIPKDININTVLNFINNIHENINFTVETSQNDSLPFLDILISWSNALPSFTVYTKPTANPSYIHWFSFHDNTIKTAVLSNLCLRALRICDPQNLKTEINRIKNIFINLSYPTNVIRKAIKKATNKYYQPNRTSHTHENILPIPNINPSEIKNNLPSEIQTVQSNTITLKKVLKPHINTIENNTGIYSIPCNNCPLKYIGETIDYTRRLYQHSYDLRFDNLNSSLTQHRRTQNHGININSAKLNKIIHNTDYRKLTESYIIKNTKNMNLNKGETTIDNTVNTFLKKSKTLQNAHRPFT